MSRDVFGLERQRVDAIWTHAKQVDLFPERGMSRGYLELVRYQQPGLSDDGCVVCSVATGDSFAGLEHGERVAVTTAAPELWTLSRWNKSLMPIEPSQRAVPPFDIVRRNNYN